MKTYNLEEINAVLKGSIIGYTSHSIEAPEQIERAKENHITFIGNKKYEKFWADSGASIAVVNEDISIAHGDNKAFIKVKNAELAMSQVLELFAPPLPHFEFDIHPTAVIHSSAKIGKGTRIGAHSYIGKDVVIGKNTTIYSNVSILDECTIGNETFGMELWFANVVM